MAKYLVQASYTAEGIKGVLQTGGTARREAVDQAVAGLGGRVESFYFAFGADDAFAIVDLPDNASAAALAMTIGSTGLVNLRTTVLIDPAEMDEAAKRKVAYRPPGK